MSRVCPTTYPNPMIRSRTHILLGLLLAFATVTAAIARPAAALLMQSGQHGAITMVICSGDGARSVMVTLDHDGQPQKPTSGHDCPPCPVCTAQAEVAADEPMMWTRPLWVARHLDTGLRVMRETGAVETGHLARAPPKES